MKTLLLITIFLNFKSAVSQDYTLEDNCDEITLSGTDYFDNYDRVINSDYIDQKEKFLESNFSLGHDLWQNSKIPLSVTRKMGFLGILPKKIKENANSLNRIYENLLVDLDKKLEKKQILEISQDRKKELIRKMTAYSGAGAEELGTKTEVSVFHLFGLCSFFSLSNQSSFLPIESPHCATLTKKLVSKLKTGEGTDFGIGSYYLRNILTSTKASRGALQAAKTIIERIINGKMRSNLFDDIYESYRKEGFSKENAYSMTWDLIYLSFVHGQHLYHLEQIYKHPVNKQTFFAAKIISAGAVLIDSLRREKDESLYTLPENIDSTCDNGKPYHFWVPAYLALQSRQDGYSESVSRRSPFLIELGYQLTSNSSGRRPDRYLSLGIYGQTNLKNRLDLSYAAAGSSFGASLDPLFHFDIDKSFNESIQKPLKPSSFLVKFLNNDHEKFLNLIFMMNPWSILQN